MAKQDSLILVQTPVSSCSPDYHCQPVPKLRTLLAPCPPVSLDPPTSWWAHVSTVKATSGKEATFVVSLRLESLGQASCFSGPPLGSLQLLLMSSAKCFTMWTIPCELSGIPAHKTFTFLFLVIIHGLHHAEGQSLWFRWGVFYWVGIWWQQVWSNSSCASYRGTHTS